jgi:hypothetical protein
MKKNQKKFFFNEEKNALSMLSKLDKTQLKNIAGGLIAYAEYARRIYTESTYVRHAV